MGKEIEKLKITDKLIRDKAIGGKVVIRNRLKGCRLHRKAVKRSSKWGVLDYGHFTPFTKCEKVTFNGRELYTTFYL